MNKDAFRPIVFFTGGTSGIGIHAACDLAYRGANLYATVRDERKGQKLLSHFEKKYSNPKGKIELIPCDLKSFTSVKSAIENFKKSCDKLDYLINNAGTWKERFERTEDSIEETFQVNVLSPYLLMEAFTDLLEKSNDARIINTASSLHQGNIRFEDIEYERGFKGFNVYRQSKLAIILLTRLFANKLNEKNIGVYCFNPGLARTDLAREAHWIKRYVFLILGMPARKAAETLIHLSTEPKKNIISGEYYFKEKVADSTQMSKNLDIALKLEKEIGKFRTEAIR
jgi:NAD(P)-dependent dehydrogenase (short-subunit alcohol dehydrogenase family)